MHLSIDLLRGLAEHRVTLEPPVTSITSIQPEAIDDVGVVDSAVKTPYHFTVDVAVVVARLSVAVVPGVYC